MLKFSASAATKGYQKAKPLLDKAQPYVVGAAVSQALSRTIGKLLGDDEKFKIFLQNQELLLENYQDIQVDLYDISSKMTGLQETLSKENEDHFNTLSGQLSEYTFSLENSLSVLNTQVERVKANQLQSEDQLEKMHLNLAGGLEDLKQRAEQIDRGFQEKWDEFYVRQVESLGSQLSRFPDIINLKDQLEKNKVEFGRNDPRTKTAAVSLEKEIHALKAKEDAFKHQLNDFKQVTDIVSIAADFVDKEFSNNFRLLANGGMKLYEGFKAITSQGTIVLAGGPLAPYLAIASGIQLIAGLFGDSDDDGLSNALTAIMDGLHSLSKQIKGGFNQILQALSELYPELQIMGYGILTIKAQQEKNQTENREEFKCLNQLIKSIHVNLVASNKALAVQPVRTAIAALNIHEQVSINKARKALHEQRSETLLKLKQQFKRAHKSHVKINNITFKSVLNFQLQETPLLLEVTREVKTRTSDSTCLNDRVTYPLDLSGFIHHFDESLMECLAKMNGDLVQTLKESSVDFQADNLSSQSI